jgi:hypothetical protein
MNILIINTYNTLWGSKNVLIHIDIIAHRNKKPFFGSNESEKTTANLTGFVSKRRSGDSAPIILKYKSKILQCNNLKSVSLRTSFHEVITFWAALTLVTSPKTLILILTFTNTIYTLFSHLPNNNSY